MNSYLFGVLAVCGLIGILVVTSAVAPGNVAVLGVLYLVLLGIAWLVLRPRGKDSGADDHHHPYDNN